MMTRCKGHLPWVALALSLLVDASAQAKLVRGRIILEGSAKTSVAYVETRMGIEEGDPITFERLQSAEDRLVSSDLFKSVQVRIDMPRQEAAQRMYVDKDVQSVDIHVVLDEKVSWIIFPNASLGAGDRAGGLVYADQNLGGHGLQLIVAGQYGEQSTFGFAGFRVPQLSSAPITYAASGIYRQEEIRFFEQHSLVQRVETQVAGGEAQMGWVSSQRFKLLFGTLYHRQWIGDMTSTLQTPLPYNGRQGNIVALQVQLLYDDTRAPEGLRTGVAISLKNELSDAFWYSDFDYIKTDFMLALYGYFRKTYPSAIFRVVLVYPTSERGVPLSEMVRAGGPDLRGYLANEFRGDTLITLQLEEAVRLLRFSKFSLAGALFADAGALVERHPGGIASQIPVATSSPKLEDFHTSIGAGLRILIPGVAIPAVKLDFAYGFDVEDTALIFSVARGSL